MDESSHEVGDDPPSGPSSLRVYVDADVLISGAASPSSHSASQVVLSLSEVTLLDAVASELVIEECRRNLNDALPDAIEPFELLVRRSLRVVSSPSKEDLPPHTGRAHWKDLPHLVTALREECAFLVTFNVRDYEPGHPAIEVLRPGPLVRRIRDRLTGL